jgi:hypothetical protein
VSADDGDTAAASGAAGAESQPDQLDPLREEQRRIEVLLACQGPRLLWFARSADHARAKRAEVEWTEDFGDPEWTKNLRTLHHLIAGARDIWERGTLGSDPADPVRMKMARVDELAGRLALPRGRPLTLESLLGHRFEVEQLLAAIGDEDYLRLRAAALYDERAGTVVSWREMYAEAPPLLAEPGAPATDGDAVAATRWMLARLLAAKEAQDLPVRARRELKARVVWLILPAIVVAAGLFAATLAIVENDVDGVLLAGAAGLAGSALGGLLQLRDEVTRGAHIREFAPFYVGQLLIGATAGLLAYAADSSGLVEIAGGAAGVATLAFAVGFSEAAFLRLLAHIGGAEPAKGD